MTKFVFFIQTPWESAEIRVVRLIDQFRHLIEQSDDLYSVEKQKLVNELQKIDVQIGLRKVSSTLSIEFPELNSNSYLDYVHLFSSMISNDEFFNFDRPIYFSLDHVLFLPYRFLFQFHRSLEYFLGKLLLKIFRRTIGKNPFHIECFFHSSDENDLRISGNDEEILYLFFRSKFLNEKNIFLDQYLWPFISQNSVLKKFLVDFTSENLCNQSTTNNTFLTDDIHLVFRCSQLNSIEKSKCSVT